jgi:hypothetical protein
MSSPIELVSTNELRFSYQNHHEISFEVNILDEEVDELRGTREQPCEEEQRRGTERNYMRVPMMKKMRETRKNSLGLQEQTFFLAWRH